MNHAIILAAGQSQRLLRNQDKLLVQVAGHPILYYSLAAINDHHLINDITLVVNKQNRNEIVKIVKTYKFTKIKTITIGGLTRQQSLEKGLQTLEKSAPRNNDLIVVHNGANPLPSYDEITKAIQKAEETSSCIVAHRIHDTIKEVKGKRVHGTVHGTVHGDPHGSSRTSLYAAQTPQVVQYALLKNALRNANKKGIEATDEAMLLEALGKKVAVEEAHKNNFKITTKEDIDRLRELLGETSKDFRAGIGQDSHMFSKTRKGLTLAGITLENEPAFEANSDGDVILHALFNAISQAIGDQSLGFYADPMCERGIKDSRKYLDIVLKKVRKMHLKIGNVGIMVECKTPKIDPLVPQLKKSLSAILGGLEPRLIGITATSGENLTVFGAGLGIQCFAIVALLSVAREPARKPAAARKSAAKKPAPTRKPPPAHNPTPARKPAKKKK